MAGVPEGRPLSGFGEAVPDVPECEPQAEEPPERRRRESRIRNISSMGMESEIWKAPEYTAHLREQGTPRRAAG